MRPNSVARRPGMKWGRRLEKARSRKREGFQLGPPFGGQALHRAKRAEAFPRPHTAQVSELRGEHGHGGL